MVADLIQVIGERSNDGFVSVRQRKALGSYTSVSLFYSTTRSRPLIPIHLRALSHVRTLFSLLEASRRRANVDYLCAVNQFNHRCTLLSIGDWQLAKTVHPFQGLKTPDVMILLFSGVSSRTSTRSRHYGSISPVSTVLGLSDGDIHDPHVPKPGHKRSHNDVERSATTPSRPATEEADGPITNC